MHLDNLPKQKNHFAGIGMVLEIILHHNFFKNIRLYADVYEFESCASHQVVRNGEYQLMSR